ncbi:MAG: pesticin C-terminus-like muramidase [Chitinophagales bacterium]
MPTPLETRIINVQKKLKLTATGIFDLATCIEIEKLKAITLPATATLFEHKKEIQKSLGFTGKDVDGIVGPATISRIEDFISKTLPGIPVGASMIVSKKSLDIIINAEISSKSAYQTKYKFPIWPDGDSGVTIGIGYDLGYVSLTQFTNDWKNVLSTVDFNKLSTTIGKKGTAAKDALSNSIKSIVVSWEQALEVFYTKSMPKYAKTTRGIYPGIEALPPDAQGAILSLVYNRGESLANTDRRKEMRNLVGLIASGNLVRIANEIRAMKRLWTNAQRGLLIRRDAEADLVEHATFFLQTDEYIFV